MIGIKIQNILLLRMRTKLIENMRPIGHIGNLSTLPHKKSITKQYVATERYEQTISSIPINEHLYLES